MQFIGDTRDAAVLRKLAETRDANGQDDPDHKYRDEQLINCKNPTVF